MYLILPTEEQKENARREFNATKETIKHDVCHLIDWISKQPHLPTITDEELLAHCLLNCKNSVEKTKNRLETYFNTKAIMPEIFKNRDPLTKEMERVCSLGMYIPLPKLTPDGYRVIMLYISDDAKHAQLPPFSHFLKSTLMSVDIMGKYDYPRGIIIVHDGKNISMEFVANAATEVHKLILLATKTIPVRYRNLYFFNMNSATQIFLSIGKTFIQKDLANRIKVLKSAKDLCDVLPKEIVPKNYGGNELPIEVLRDNWFAEIKNYRDFLINTENFESDLSKRPESKSGLSFEELNGSFRKIDID